MLSNPIPPSAYIEEGTVVQVDSKSMVCKVKTLRGQVLPSVPYPLPFGGSDRSGLRFSPQVGNRVVLNYGLGYPIIQCYLPRIQGVSGTNALTLHDGETSPNTGGFGYSSEMLGDQNKPSDIHDGDNVLSSIGGAIVATLRAGTVILRGSRLAEITLSKLGGLVRVVSRNWEHFTDVSSDVVKNYKGRVYRYVGYATTYARGKVEDYRLNFYYGDVGAAETVKTNYATYTGTPPTSTVQYKEQVTDGSNELMRRTLDNSGHEEIWIKNGSEFIRVQKTGAAITLAWNDQNTVVIDSGKIKAHHHSGADVTLDASGVTAVMGNGNVTITNDSTIMANGGHSITITSGEVTIV